MKKISFLITFVIFLFIPNIVSAQSEPYIINDFSSKLTINQDASVTVRETIDVFFNEQRHGIYRTIPVVYREAASSAYRNEGKVINSKLEVLSVNEDYEVSREGDYVEIKIGDPDKYISGRKTYEINYRVRNIIQRYEDYDELYWNVLGSGWDTNIFAASASVNSEFADVQEIQCFEGQVGVDSKCESLTHNETSASFVAGTSLGNGRDMTIVVGLDDDNALNFSTSLIDQIRDYWGYPVAFLPLLVMSYFWFKKGRDERFVGDNVYYLPAQAGSPQNSEVETTPIIGKREFLPMVYSPINGLTPAEVGTLVDEKVDIHDVVAEITELGRLGYLKIEKLNKKLAKDDYLIMKLKETDEKLRDYQKYLFDSIFSYGENGEVKLSELKKKFYTKLEEFRNKLYAHMDQEKYFFDRPDKVRIKWFVIVGIIEAIAFFSAINAADSTGNFIPLIILVVASIPTFILAYQMPRKTPKGYALFRQTKGLAFYLGKGKWREEIKEKQLFLDEILPLAIALGVVKNLARDMQDLGIKEPSYFTGSGVAWASSISSFNSAASSSMTPPSSSGGSGFSGGSSGGGFGGGGGGSW